MARKPPPVQQAHVSRKAAGRKPSKKAEVTRQRILQSAAKAFAAKGYQLALLSEIAEDAGVHVTALYYYFDTKEHLVEEMLNRFAASGYQAVAAQVQALAPEANYREKITAAAVAQLRSMLSQPDTMAAHSRVLYQVPQDVRDRHFVLLRKNFLYWRGLVRGAWESGEVRGDLDPTIATQILMGSLNWTPEWYKPGRMTPDDIARVAVAIMFDGMAPRKLQPAAAGPKRKAR